MTTAESLRAAEDEETDAHRLYIEHHPWLVAWLARRVGCRETADDLAHDAFERLLGRSGQGDLRRPGRFLGRIAHGLMVDHLRRRDLERAYFEALAELPAEVAASPAERHEALETLARIDRMLSGLGARRRRVLLLSRLEGLSHPRIAGRLGVSLSTVEKDMAAALRHCYLALAEEQTAE